MPKDYITRNEFNSFKLEVNNRFDRIEVRLDRLEVAIERIDHNVSIIAEAIMMMSEKTDRILETMEASRLRQEKINSETGFRLHRLEDEVFD